MDKLNLEVGWDVDNASLKAGLDQSKKTIEGVGQSVDVVDSKVTTNLNKLNQQLNTTKGNFNGLQNSINQIGRELPAFTYSAQTGFMAISNNLPILADEIAKIRKENDLLSASGQKGVPVWKQLLGGLLSWQTGMVVGITLLTVYGKEIGEWIKGLFGAKKEIDKLAESQKSLNESLKSSEYQNAVIEVTKLEVAVSLAKKGFISKKTAVEEYNKTIGKTTGEVKTLDEIEKFLVKNADNYIKMTLYKAAAQLQLAEAAKKASEIQENSMKKSEEFTNVMDQGLLSMLTSGGEFSQGALTMDQADAELKARGEKRKQRIEKQLEDDRNAYENNAKELLKKSQEYANQMGISIFGDGPGDQKDKDSLTKSYTDILKISKEGLAKIKDLDTEYASQLLSSDEAEKQALRDKFADFRKIIEEENEKIIAYNKKNKKNVPLLNVDAVNPIEQRASEQLDYTQNTARLQKQYDEEYKVFVEYQKLKEETNAEYADMRFADDLEKIKSFETRLQTEIASIDPKTTNALEKKRLEELLKLQKDNTKRVQEAEDKRMIEALGSVKSFNDKRLEIEKKYQEMRKSLGTNISPEQEQIIQQKESKDISKLAVDELQQSEAWALLFSDLDRLTISQIDKLINEIETRFDDLSVYFDPIDLSAIRQKLQEAREEIINQNPFKAVGDSLANIFKGASEDSGQSTQDIQKQWRNLSKATDKSFEFINDAVNSTAFLKDALGETGAASIGMLQSISLAAIGVATAIKSAEKASVILAVIQAALVAMQAVFSFLDSGAKRRNEELKKEQEYYNVLSDTFDILIDKQRKLFEEKNGKGALKAYEEALELVGAKQVANRKSLEAWFSQGASWNSHSNWYKYDRDLGNVLSRQKLLNMTGKEWEDLLRNQPELWARLPQEVRNYAQSVVDAKEETEDLKKTIQEALTGVSLDDLRSEFESLATNANLTFEDISKSFYKNMQKAVLRLIQDDKFTSDMKNWYDNLLRAMDDDNITEAESNLLKEQYKSIAEAQNARYKAIMDVIGGSDAFADDSQLKAESGIERITEQTATELMGITRAQYDVSKQHLLVAQKSLDFDTRANDMLIQSLKHQAAIEQNTANTVDQLKLVVEEIKTTNRNLGGKYGG